MTIDAQPVRIKDTVGSGDAVLAGFLAYKMKGRSVKDSLQVANNLSSYVAGQQGACPDHRSEDMLWVRLLWRILFVNSLKFGLLFSVHALEDIASNCPPLLKLTPEAAVNGFAQAKFCFRTTGCGPVVYTIRELR